MTLITLHSRIHFASNILEEALRAEVDSRRAACTLLIHPAELRDKEFLARVEDGLQSSFDVIALATEPTHTKYDTSDAILACADAHPIDLIVAIGGAEVIAHARRGRTMIARNRYAAHTPPERGKIREQDLGPDFFVVPGMDGLPDPCLEANGSSQIKANPPSVIICDPTVLGPAEEQELACVITQAMGRSMTALMADTFNPLADGMAIDALSRLSSARDRYSPRDLMAATLNGAIAIQKGPGLVEAFRFSYGKCTNGDIDSALLHRVLLARMLSSTKSSNADLIGRVLGMPPDMALADFVTEFLQDLPLPSSLHEIGLEWEEVEETLNYMVPRFGVPQLGSAQEVRRVLQDVF